MPPFTQNGERAQSMLLVVVALRAVSTSTLDNISRALYMAVCGIFGLLSAAGVLSSSSSRARHTHRTLTVS